MWRAYHAGVPEAEAKKFWAIVPPTRRLALSYRSRRRPKLPPVNFGALALKRIYFA
jgi:hypothetical protein